jgi:hypothetical protein
MNRWRFFTTLLILSLIVMPLTVYGCTNSPVTNTFEYSDFTRLDIQNAFNAQVIQSATYNVTVTSSKALVDYLSVAKTGDTLTIKLQPNHPFTDFVLMRKTLKVKIMMPVLHSIVLSGASECVIKGFKSTNTLDLDVSGASTMSLDNIEAGNADFLVSGASKLKGKVTATNLKFDISGASKVELDGEGDDIRLAASGSSKVNLQEFVSQTATVTLSGASQVTVDARKHLDGSLSGASSLFFLNNPKVEVEVLGASTVKHK